MHFKPAALTAAAALTAGVAADFIVITDYPQALETLSPDQASSWIASNLPSIQAEFASLATDSSYIAQATSVIPELRGFAATATVSIPPVVTALDDFTIFTTVPSWYTELPSGVRSFYDDAARRVESILDGVVPANATASGNVTVTPSATPSLTPSGSQLPEHTGAAGKVGVMGAGVAAGLMGIFFM